MTVFGAPPQRFLDPRVIVSHFHLRDGDSIADFGAGTGFYLKPLSEAVGASGHVYALEIQRMLVDKLIEKARAERLANVNPIWCDLERIGGTKLGDAILDAGMLVNTLFQLEQKNIALQEVQRTLRGGGKLFVIEWKDSFGGMGPRPEDVLSEDQVKRLVNDVGFEFERSFPAGDHHYGLVFRKP